MRLEISVCCFRNRNYARAVGIDFPFGKQGEAVFCAPAVPWQGVPKRYRLSIFLQTTEAQASTCRLGEPRMSAGP